MLKIVEIAKAWIAAADPTPEQKEIAEYRIKICGECPHKEAVRCGLCGCPLQKKIFSPKPGPEACPDKRWEK